MMELKAHPDQRVIPVLTDPREERGSPGKTESLAGRGSPAALERRVLLATGVSLDPQGRRGTKAPRAWMVLLESGAAMEKEAPQARRETVVHEESRESLGHPVTKVGKDPSDHPVTRVNLDHQDPRATGETTAPAAMRAPRDCLEHLGCLEILA